jgi:hypothetical protein
VDGAKVGVRWIATLLVILGVWATLATVEATGAAGHADRLDFAPIASSVLTRPTPVKGTDGRFHIVYEVVLTNNTPVTMGVDGFEVRDTRTRRVLARLSGPTLAASMGPVAGPPATSTNEPPDLKPAAGLSEEAASDAATTMASSQTSVVWLDLKVDSARPRLSSTASSPPAGRRPVRSSVSAGSSDASRLEAPRSSSDRRSVRASGWPTRVAAPIPPTIAARSPRSTVNCWP